VEIRPLDGCDQAALTAFLDRIPEGDRTFFKENIEDPAVVDAWTRPGGTRSIAVDGERVAGYVAVVPLHGWSSHVGEIRIVVDPDHRGRGVGRMLVRHAVREALALGLTRLVVEVVADQAPAIGLFRSHGFVPEALLKDHVRDRHGELRDLMILAHSVDEQHAALAAAGIAESL
jgi:ribosomal protein S18 acetylase RimI-like enzyme